MGQNIKICALTTISKTMDWFIVDSMRNLSENGYDVTLICSMDDDFAQNNSDFAKCINLDMQRGVSFKDMLTKPLQLRKIFKENKFDAIYYMTPNVSLYASLGGILAGIKTRIYAQAGLRYVSLSGFRRFIFKAIEKITCLFSTHIRSVSHKNMQFAIDEKLCSANKISVVGKGGTVGVSLQECDSVNRSEERINIRDKYNIEKDAFVYGYVGRINTDKGINELINAFKAISEKKSNTYLLLVGMVDDANPIFPENMAYAEENPRIIMTGNVPKHDVYKYMSAFDVLTHPTYREGFGKVLQEAMGMYIPIITTNIPGPSEVIENNISGALVPAKDTDALAEMMISFYENSDLREFYSTEGRKRAEAYFDRPIMLNNILLDMNKIFNK